MNNLNAKQEAFCQHYAVSHNAAQAAREAGYSQNSAYNQGYRLMNDDEVQKMIAFELKESKERNLKDHDQLIEQLKDEALGKVGGHTGGSRLKALELLMKYYGMIDDKQKLEVNMDSSEWFGSLDFIKEDSLN